MVWMLFNCKVKYKLHDGFKFSRKEPYVMLSNHVFMFDVIHTALFLWKVPHIVASQTLFNKKGLGFLLKHIAHAIPKSKGSSDIRTAREIIGAAKRGYPILIFPEGDTTFYGETGYIEESTFKLVKKLGLDVVTNNIKGGYLSYPRWALFKRRNRRAEFNYHVTITKEELKDMSLDEVKAVIKKALYNNDYEYQREHMIKHPGKNKAIGFENVVYICPECESIDTIKTSGDKIYCEHCHTEGLMNDYGFIEGFKFDNLIEWDQFQRQFNDKLRQTEVSTDADLYYADYTQKDNQLVGRVNIRYHEGRLHFTGALEEVILINEIRNPIITLRRNLSFSYKERDFFIRLDSKAAYFLRITQEKY